MWLISFVTKATNLIPTSIRSTLIALFALLVGFELGKYVAKEDFLLQQELAVLQQNYKKELKTKETTKETQTLSHALSEKMTWVTDAREEAHHDTTTYARTISHRYGSDSLHISAQDTPKRTDTRYADLRSSTQTGLVDRSQIWGFSEKDRQFLIDEAARADKIDQELKLCKVTLDNIYINHARYKQAIYRYERSLQDKKPE